MVKEIVKRFRRIPDRESMRLLRGDRTRKSVDQNCQFFLNLDTESDHKPNFLRISESKSNFVIFAIFASVEFVESILSVHPNLTVCVAYPLSSDKNDSKIASLLGASDADWETLEYSLGAKFDKQAKKLY